MTASLLPLRRQLGPYQILSLLGAGGMGEVYRARDTRLQRDVAVKVLPPDFAENREWVKRLEREARAVSQLNHPNIVAVYDVGSEAGFEYVVMELLEGETLAEKLLRGPLSPRKALDYATQIARGLMAAHEKNIVHRDLKPENIFLTRDGRLKILDFGLARHLSAMHTGLETSRLTTPGMVMGTAAYMAPEQARGLPVDHRSDIFSFGVVLYEMLAGTNPFMAETAFETMTAILNREPADLGQLVPDLPPILRRVVLHCLEKSPEARFQTAHDLVFDLENCSGVVWTGTSGGLALPQPKPRRLRRAVLIGTVLAVAAAIGFLLLGRTETRPATEPTFRRLTFGRGIVESARFTVDGGTVVYSASWDGQPLRLHLLRTDRPESQPLALPDANLAAISPAGEMAITLNGKVFDWWGGGTLAVVPVLGGTPREVLESVVLADWAPDGRMAVWRNTNSGPQLEYPLGRVLHKSDEVIMALRVSPKGDMVAVHIAGGRDMTGQVAVIDLRGKRRTLVQKVVASPGMAWTPDGKEIWFAASPVGGTSMPSIYAVNLEGEQRLVARMTGWLWLHDIARDGTVLLSYNMAQSGILLDSPGQPRERDLAWLDGSVVADISPDGREVLFSESGEAVRFVTTIYMRGIDDSPAVRLGEGIALAFSPTGDRVLARRRGANREELILLPKRAGKIEPLRNDLDCVWGDWLPDGRILISAQTPQGPRMFIQSPGTASPQPLTPSGWFVNTVVDPEGGGSVKPVSPDGRWVVLADAQRRTWLYPIGSDGRQMKRLENLTPIDRVAGWSRDGSRIYVYDRLAVPIRVDEVVLATGERKPFRELSVADLGGVFRIGPVLLMPDGQSFAYGYYRTLSTLYTANGLK